jgi:Fur family ferric uptake transcriptional regulator
MRTNGKETGKLRMTRQRRALLEAIEKSHAHPTADEVHRLVRRRLPRISLGTVYRNLEVLADLGMIQKVELGSGQRRYDAVREHHYHVRCQRCGRVEDVWLRRARGLETAAQRQSGYEITGHRLDFLGLCARCRTERPGAPTGTVGTEEKGATTEGPPPALRGAH